jgi:hypothetical protein
MTAGRLHLLAEAALCFEQAGQPAEAARCRDKAGEPVAAAELFRAAGELGKAADCYRRGGRTAEAVSCLLALGRPEDAAALWEEAGDPLEAAWVLAIDAHAPQRARELLTSASPGHASQRPGRGGALRFAIVGAVCAHLERQSAELADVLDGVELSLPEIAPASEQAKVLRWAVAAGDLLGRPDLGARVFGAAYRCGLRGTASLWREWARSALGGTAGIPERDL